MARNRILLEIAVESVDDALVAVAAGADRLEICAGLACGGLTPSIGVVTAIRRAVAVPILVMVRPRSGGFCYSELEFETIRADAEALLAPPASADGIVTGLLHEKGTVNVERCQELTQPFGGKQLVFHRAIDITPDPLAALDAIVESGFTRILTSGGRPTAVEAGALDTIVGLAERAAGRVEILPGSGIRSNNVAQVLVRTRSTQVHAACRSPARDMRIRGRGRMTLQTINGASADTYAYTDRFQVASLRAALDHVSDSPA